MTSDISATTEAAISAALNQNWDEAIKLNIAILKEKKPNIDANNRLAFAYLKTGQISLAKQFFGAVLKLDPYNQIAQKNLNKLDVVRQKDLKKNSTISTPMSPLVFLEEPGKTKMVTCVNPAPTKILSSLGSGQEVFLKAKKHSAEVRDEYDNYLGALPDDLSYKLLKFISGGNKYQIIVKGIGKNSLTVLIREISRGKNFGSQPSFSSSTAFVPYTQSENNSEEKPDTAATGEADDDNEKSEE